MTIASYIEKVAAISLAITRADRAFASSIRLTRLVDEVSTYTVTCTGAADPREFEGYEDAAEFVDGQRDMARAEEVLRVLEALA